MSATSKNFKKFLKILIIIQLNHQPWGRMLFDWNIFVKVLALQLTRNLAEEIREYLRVIII